MKYILLILALLGTTLTADAQLRLGLKTNYGKTMSTPNTIQYGDEQGYLAYNLTYTGTSDNVSFGLTSYYEAGYLFFQSDMLYRKSTSNFTFQNFTEAGAPVLRFEETNHMLHLPIQGGILYKDFKFGVGPMFNLNLDSELVLDQMDQFETNARDWAMGFQFMVGYKLMKNVHLDLKFERTFNNIGDHYIYRNEPTSLSTSPNMLSASIALVL